MNANLTPAPAARLQSIEPCHDETSTPTTAASKIARARVASSSAVGTPAPNSVFSMRAIAAGVAGAARLRAVGDGGGGGSATCFGGADHFDRHSAPASGCTSTT